MNDRLSESVSVLTRPVECSTQDMVKVAYGTGVIPTDTATTYIISATTASPETYVHKISLTGLLPNTVYYYKAFQGSSVSAQYSFHTAVNPGTPFRMAFVADFRTGTTYHAQIAALVLTYDPRFSLYGGDYCYTAAYADWKNEFFLANELTLDSHAPFFPAIGNHETWGQNTKAFTRSPESPSGTQDYYSFDYGDVHFLCLNNQVSYAAGSAQYNFAAADLAATTKPWKIVYCHNPAYCNGGHNEDAGMVAMSQNIFVPNGVDMVIAGHSHFYQHNYVNGIHHMVIGDAGPPPAAPGYAAYTVMSVADYEFGIIDVTTTSFTLQIYTNLNQKIDSIRLVKPAPSGGPISGTKSVGPAPSDFSTLTQAAAYLRTTGNGVNGPLILELKSGYSSAPEIFPLTFNAIPGSSATNTVTIRPAAGTTGRIITTANADGTLILNSVSNLIIDGRPGGTGTSQLTIENQHLAGNTLRFINDASNNTIRYCTVKGINNKTTTDAAPGVVFFSTTTLSTGNDNNVIDHCTLSNGATLPLYLVYSKGTAAKENSSITFSNNEFSNFSSSAIYLSSTGNGNNWLISGNSFYYNYSVAPSASQTVIRFGSETATGNLITGNFIGGQSAQCGGSQWTVNGTLTFTGVWAASANITKNRIGNVGSTQSSATPTIYGIYKTGTSTQPNEISNNMVSLSGGSATNPFLYGIYDNSAAGTTINVYYNSILVSGPATTSSSTYAFYRGSTVTQVLRDNIFSNQRTAGGSGKHYAIYSSATGTLNSDFNDLFSSAGPLGYYNGSDRTTLANWQSATGGDAASVSVAPAFISASDLHIQWDANLNNKGTPVPSLTLDYDGNIRGNPPDVGINEFSLARSWTGNVSSDWNNSANWSPFGVPASMQNILILTGAPNYPLINTGTITFNDLTLAPGTHLTVSPGCTMNINGSLTIQDGGVLTNNGTMVVQGSIYK